MNSNWQKLNENGYVVIPVLNNLGELRIKMINDLKSMPEFKNSDLAFNTGHVMGGFSALGNASSFHLPIVRSLRVATHPIVYNGIFKEALDADNELKLEQIIDRFKHQTPNKKIASENYHRDESPCSEGDQIFGGWINLDLNSQYFAGCPGTHKHTSNQNGFALISKEEYKEFAKMEQLIEIPPGHIFIFYEHMVHKVYRSKNKWVDRLFMGWRLTKSDECIHGNDNLRQMLHDKAVIPLKSGQTPPMYARLHLTNWVEKIVDFSKVMQDKCIETKEIKSGKKAGVYQIVHRFMKSLKDLDMDIYPAYEEDEIKILIPHRL